jgi:hypothetical protein
MQAEKVYKKFLELAKYYLKELDYYGKNQFKYKPSDGAWSLGQLYDHLINGTYAFHLKEIENCLAHKHGRDGGPKRFKGKLIFFLNGFPKMKIKGISASKYTPAQPESPVKMKDEVYRFIKVMQKVSKDIDQANNPTYKTLHPSFGMLTALEWYMVIEMHFRHHIKQKTKLDEVVRSYSKESPIVESEVDDHNFMESDLI